MQFYAWISTVDARYNEPSCNELFSFINSFRPKEQNRSALPSLNLLHMSEPLFSCIPGKSKYSISHSLPQKSCQSSSPDLKDRVRSEIPLGQSKQSSGNRSVWILRPISVNGQMSSLKLFRFECSADHMLLRNDTLLWKFKRIDTYL